MVKTTGLCSATWWTRERPDRSVVREMAARAPYRVRTGLHLETSGATCLAHLGVAGGPRSHTPDRDVARGRSVPRILVGFHGRLDNRDELLGSLGSGGSPGGKHVSDALLVECSYRREGPGFLRRLLGDFALVLWDPRRRKLLVARDPMAMKPLYYVHDEDRTFVASEIRQLLAARSVSRRLSKPAVSAYLGGGEIPTDRTFYDGVSQVPPGSFVVFEDGRARTESFFGLLAELPDSPDPGDLETRFLECFRASVERRVRGVSSVGVALSGGLDSGSIASMLGSLRAEHRLSASLHTYSWAFPTLPECDERVVSRVIVDHFGFAHRDLNAEKAHPLQGFPDHGPHEDDPLIFPYQPILEKTFAAAAFDGVDLLMSGDRGDLVAGDYVYDLSGEVLAGHPFRALRGMETLRRRHGRGWFEAALRYVMRPGASRARAAYRRARRIDPGWRRPTNGSQWPDWVREDFLAAVAPPAPDPDPDGIYWLDPARRRRARTVFTNLHLRGMVLTERSHAAAGIDFADPWSDLELVGLCIAADQRLLNHPSEEKRMVRRAMAGTMPEEARVACRKTPPTPLYHRALREWEVGTVQCLLTDPRVADLGWVDRNVLASHYEEFVSGNELQPEFWWTLSLEMWLRRFW